MKLTDNEHVELDELEQQTVERINRLFNDEMASIRALHAAYKKDLNNNLLIYKDLIDKCIHDKHQLTFMQMNFIIYNVGKQCVMRIIDDVNSTINTIALHSSYIYIKMLEDEGIQTFLNAMKEIKK